MTTPEYLALAYTLVAVVSLELVATREQSRAILQDCDPIVRIAVLVTASVGWPVFWIVGLACMRKEPK